MSVGVEGDPERAPNIAFLLVCQRGSPTSCFWLSQSQNPICAGRGFFWIPPAPDSTRPFSL